MKKQIISITFTILMVMILIGGMHYQTEHLENLRTSITWLYWAIAVLLSAGGMFELYQILAVSKSEGDSIDNSNVDKLLKELKEPKSKILSFFGLMLECSLITTFAMLGSHFLFATLVITAIIQHASKKSLKEYSERLEEDNGKL